MRPKNLCKNMKISLLTRYGSVAWQSAAVNVWPPLAVADCNPRDMNWSWTAHGYRSSSCGAHTVADNRYTVIQLRYVQLYCDDDAAPPPYDDD